MVLNKEQVMEQVKNLIGDNTDDDSLKFLEDISDTLDDFSSKLEGDGEDWKQKYEDNDKEWRQKYHDRFFSGTSNDASEPTNDLLEPSSTETNDDEYDPSSVTFDDLFTEQ